MPPPGLRTDQVDVRDPGDLPMLPPSSSKSAPKHRESSSPDVQMGKERKGRLAPNRLVFNTKASGQCMARRPLTRNSSAQSSPDHTSSAASSNVPMQSTKSKAASLRITSNPPPITRRPTGKSLEDAQIKTRVKSAHPPSPPQKSTAATRRAEKALDLRTVLKNPKIGGVGDPLTFYGPDVVKIAQRGERFSEQVIVTGSSLKSKSGIRSYERLLGRSGIGIGQDERDVFTAAVGNYTEIQSGRRLPAD